ncbi:hypothetical protein N7G274_008105 [Stereocaulon virgatum]|uniref:Uncharacterized protein n=1 Tax=Stereocaulon virgatum TaxID=373712 RepID=A0ABR4A193_9LECA
MGSSEYDLSLGVGAGLTQPIAESLNSWANCTQENPSQLHGVASSLDVKNPASSSVNIMSLPRELRDQIYRDLLAIVYQADLYGPIKKALQTINVPRVERLPDSEMWLDHVRLPPNFPAAHADTVSLYTLGKIRKDCYAREKFSHRLETTALEILKASHAIRDEAITVPQTGTLLFLLDSPEKVSQYEMLDLDVIPPFRNFEILLDLISIFVIRLKFSDKEAAIRATPRIVSHLAAMSHNPDTCTIRITHLLCPPFLMMTRLCDAMMRMTSFKTVDLKLANLFLRWKGTLEGSTDQLKTYNRECRDKTALANQNLATSLTAALGPSERTTDSDRYECWRYYPRAHVSKCGPLIVEDH